MKKKIHPIVLTILIVVIFIFALYDHNYDSIDEVTLYAQEGYIDLSELNYDRQVARLDGEWEFYWNKLINPGDPIIPGPSDYIEIPGSWNHHEANKEETAYGYASFRLRFETDQALILALKIPRMFTANKLWVNGQPLAFAGQVGKSLEASSPKYLPQNVSFKSQKGTNEILIQVSNYHHPSGGMSENIYLGHEKQINKLRTMSLASELILFASLTIIGLYHLSIYILRRKGPLSLPFGLFCLSIGIRTLLVGERFIVYLFPNINWELDYKIQTLAFYFTVSLIITFLRNFFQGYFKDKIVNLSWIVSLIFAALVIATPARVYLRLNPIYQIWAILLAIYVFVVLIKIALNKEKGSKLIVLGAFSLIFGSVNDILYHSIFMKEEGNLILKTLVNKGNLSSLGQLIFAFLTSLMVTRKFTNALDQEEYLTDELKTINADLDQLVKSRTKDLERSKAKIESQKQELEKSNKALRDLSYKDPLSGLWNRRKYNETIQYEWHRSLKYEKPLSLIIMDIDLFKELNDYYGHMVGDDSLMQIGQVLKETLRRPSDIVVRFGGDEFAVILPDTDKNEAMAIANKIRENIHDLNIPHKRSFVSDFLTVSVGVSSRVPNKKSTHEELFDLADKALYLAKDRGKNQVVYLPEEICT